MKKVVSLILAAAMTISAAATASAVEYGAEYTNQPSNSYTQKFSDVSTSHWAFSYIGEMAERGVLSGYPNGKFYPENNVSRAEFAKIMTITAGLPLGDTYQVFEDVPTSHWANIYINTASSFLSGYSVGGTMVYRPETPAMREDIAVALVKLKGYDITGYDESMLRTMFHDFDSISSGARPYVATAVERGLVSGFDDDTFKGQNPINRAQAATMLWRAYQYGNDNKDFNMSTTVTPTPTAEPVPTIAPTPAPVPTAAPTSAPTDDDDAWNVWDSTPKPTFEPTPEPVREKPYILDSITKADISNTFTMMTTDGDNVYYYDDSDNMVYKINMQSEKVTDVADVSELQIPMEVESRDDDGTITEYLKDFKIEQLYYDNTNNKLLAKGIFRSITDYYGFEDKRQSFSAIVSIDGECVEYEKDDVSEPIVKTGNPNGLNGKYVFELKSGSNMYKFDTWVGSAYLQKYDFNTGNWEKVGDNVGGNYIGYRNDGFYSWDTVNGNIIKCGFNSKLIKFDMNTKENVDVLDFNKIPQGSTFVQRDDQQIFVGNNEQLIFYDNAAGSIRIFKKR